MLKMFNLSCQVAGTDEAGRGCLAGPVTAAAVILPKDFKNKLLNDSKQTKLSDRNKLKEIIIQEAVSYGIAHVYMEEIDEINILNASILAMHRAIERLSCEPEYIIVDGNKFKPYRDISHECIIKGDGKFLSIAAASILAKTARDEFMKKIHHEFPVYNWKQNKGYPTKEHRNAIREFGSTPYHRKSFKLLPEQLKLAL
jgi:ribonuclease HII